MLNRLSFSAKRSTRAGAYLRAEVDGIPCNLIARSDSLIILKGDYLNG